MMTTLNKCAGNPDLWSTENYHIVVGKDNFGYEIINTQTQAVELISDQEPQTVMAMMWLQESYDEVMGDPEREFKVRKNKTALGHGSQPQIVN